MDISLSLLPMAVSESAEGWVLILLVGKCKWRRWFPSENLTENWKMELSKRENFLQNNEYKSCVVMAMWSSQLDQFNAVSETRCYISIIWQSVLQAAYCKSPVSTQIRGRCAAESAKNIFDLNFTGDCFFTVMKIVVTEDHDGDSFSLMSYGRWTSRLQWWYDITNGRHWALRAVF